MSLFVVEQKPTTAAGSVINWNGGQRITLTPGDTATCTTLRPGQIYGIFCYNSAQHDNNARLTVVWSNSQPPAFVTIPGTTANAGLASMFFVSGSDTQTVSCSLPQDASIAKVEVWIGSVSMPTNTSGLTNRALPMDGSQQPFNKYVRYFAVPASKWYQLRIGSVITQYISCQFRQSRAVVFVVNQTVNGLLPDQIVAVGSAAAQVETSQTTQQYVEENLQGDGTQWVWMNADSQQDSQQATISLQPLT